MDTVSPTKRSWNMSRIRSKRTKPEQIVASYLRDCHLGYRRYSSNLPGKPDFVLTKYHAVIFVNGCFWHGHEGCKRATIPKTNTEWWIAKIQRTKARDEKECELLRSLGWRVFVIWECELGKNAEFRLKELIKDILMEDVYSTELDDASF